MPTILWLLLLTAPGCHRYLVATPNILHGQNPEAVYEQCPADCRTPETPVVYATDRAIAGRVDDQPRYGFGRAGQLAFGIAQVNLGPETNWPGLSRDSTLAKRSREHAIELTSIREVGVFKPVLDADDNTATKLATYRVIDDAQRRDQLNKLLKTRLAQTTHKDVFIFVHGVNCSFEDAAFRAAEVWHFMGRVGVPVAYTWPAGLGGIRGYAYDRESGEFTVSHLRRFIQLVADCPDVERVHLIAHSRGVDVTTSALRELHIACRAQGKSTQEALKLENLILAAPDVDEEVFAQRFIGENMLSAARRTTIYVSEHDKAIELSDVVFASRRRLGMLAAKDFSPRMRHALAKMPNVQFIECKVSGIAMTHNYVFTHPAALSDLILVLRDRRDPGEANGRPLRQPAEGIWELTDDYLARR